MVVSRRSKPCLQRSQIISRTVRPVLQSWVWIKGYFIVYILHGSIWHQTISWAILVSTTTSRIRYEDDKIGDDSGWGRKKWPQPPWHPKPSSLLFSHRNIPQPPTIESDLHPPRAPSHRGRAPSCSSTPLSAKVSAALITDWRGRPVSAEALPASPGGADVAWRGGADPDDPLAWGGETWTIRFDMTEARHVLRVNVLSFLAISWPYGESVRRMRDTLA